ncbi:MAG: lipid A biosynthesis lauroyl acyltransferase [Pseudomonadota bacterium]
MAERSIFRIKLQKYVSHPLQGLAAYCAYGLFRALPLDAASGLGGAMARMIGPRLGQSKKARNNLIRAFPEKSTAEIEIIIRDMWENLGRGAAEIPHVRNIACPGPHLEIVGLEHGMALKEDGKPGIFFTGHLANWEISMLIARILDLPMMAVYRAPDNPWVDQLFVKARKAFKGEMVPKGAPGARKMTAFLRKGGHVAMLVDQKMSNGIAVPFFGRDAMTAPALAQFAIKYDCPVVPVRVERIKGTQFRMTIEPPLVLPQTDNRHDDILTIMTMVNQRLENWIRERPAQWLWLHKRWPN